MSELDFTDSAPPHRRLPSSGRGVSAAFIYLVGTLVAVASLIVIVEVIRVEMLILDYTEAVKEINSKDLQRRR